MVTKEVPNLPLFGGFLIKIRLQAGIKSQRQVASIIQRDLDTGASRFPQLETISANQVRADEKGLVDDIPPARLRAYAELYKVPYEEILAELIKEKYGADLVPRGAEQFTTIKNVVPRENAPILEAVEAALESDKREEVADCIERMLALAFGRPYPPGVTAEQEAEKASSGNPTRSPVTPEVRRKGKGAA